MVDDYNLVTAGDALEDWGNDVAGGFVALDNGLLEVLMPGRSVGALEVHVHGVVWRQSDQSTENVFDADSLLEQGIDDIAAALNKWGLAQVGEDGQDRVEGLELGLFGGVC